MRFSIIVVTLQLFLFNSIKYVYSQQDKQHQSIQRQNFLPKTVIIKVKPQFRNSLLSEKKRLSFIQKSLPGITIQSLKKFIQIPLPETENITSKKPTIHGKTDLSLIYEVVYKEDIPVQKAIHYFYKSGLVEYAEPSYIDQVLFVPNDPEALPTSGKQWALKRIKAYEAWDIEKGDTNVVVGIVDTDINIDHPDLKNKIKYNYLDPINGLDDDNDGFIDNYYGWDISEKDNDPRAKRVAIKTTVKTAAGKDSVTVDTVSGNGHATQVSGCASAEANNGIGVAGSGFNTKFLPVKAMLDTGAKKGNISEGYEGLLYAASKGCKVINLSWGGGNSYSAARQDIINYAVEKYDVVIVAAAGNNSIEESFYPASYDNVLSVAALDSATTSGKNIEVKWAHASYSNDVDISAPGSTIYTTVGNQYGYTGGSSFAAPYVAGAAALMRSKFPHLNALQVQNRLRITADIIDTLPENIKYKEKLGRGRLNMWKALTDSLSPAIRMVNNNFPDNYTTFASKGDTIKLSCKFVNYLATAQNLQITISSNSSLAKFLDSTSTFKSVKTLDSINNSNNPFILVLNENIPPNFQLIFRLDFLDGNYKDYQYFRKTVNPSYINVDNGTLDVTLTSLGRIGFNDSEDLQGRGFIYKGFSMLFESGLLVSNSKEKVSDCVRGNPTGTTDFDFEIVNNIVKSNATVASIESATKYKDYLAAKVGVEVSQKSYSWNSFPNSKFIILSYDIKNTSDKDIDTLYAGIFTDWDIFPDPKMMLPSYNKADYIPALKAGYVFNTNPNGLYGGVQLLSNYSTSCYSLDHDHTDSATINPNDGFTTLEKYTTLSSGTAHALAGKGERGGDVSQVVGGTITGLKKDAVKNITFAMIAGDNLQDIATVAQAAKAKYDSLNTTLAIQASVIPVYYLHLFPNPSNTVIHSVEIVPEKLTATFTDITGKELETVYLTPGSTFSLNLNKYTMGIYLLKIQGEKGTQLLKIIRN